MKHVMIALCLSGFFILSACGVKPGALEAPPGSEPTDFPGTYPAPY